MRVIKSPRFEEEIEIIVDIAHDVIVVLGIFSANQWVL
jgi:hypothetical protein